MTAKTVAAATRKGGRVAGVEASPPTREIILDTAERLFAARGVEGVALRDLAHEMSLTAPSLYNHLASKQALYEAVLERGLRPIVAILIEAWQPGAFHAERVRATTDKLIGHLSMHPHLARLLQRALLDESGRFQTLVARWVGPLYREGVAVIRETAGAAGWESAEVPHLTIGLFGMVFAYFINAATLGRMTAWIDDPMAARSLATQRRFLEKALYRMLGPQLGLATSTRKRPVS